jgi:hypothetical protein
MLDSLYNVIMMRVNVIVLLAINQAMTVHRKQTSLALQQIKTSVARNLIQLIRSEQLQNALSGYPCKELQIQVRKAQSNYKCG